MTIKMPNQKALAKIAQDRTCQPHVVIDAITGEVYGEYPDMLTAERDAFRLIEQYPGIEFQLQFAG